MLSKQDRDVTNAAVTDHQVDVKLIAATKEELGSYAAAGRFRPDLYHRLAVVVLPLPPLRQRGEEIVWLGTRAGIEARVVPAAGFAIENGVITHPVSEITIAGNLIDMFGGMRPADDLIYRFAVNAPTVAVEGLTIAGR